LYYLLQGTLVLDEFATGTVSLNSSLEPATCDISSTDYSCEIYDWGGGWTGYIQVITDDPLTELDESESIACNYDRVYVALEEKTSGYVEPTALINCKEGSASIVRGYIDLLDDRSSLIETNDVPAIRIFSAIGVDLQTTDINLEAAPQGNCSYLSSTYSCATEDYSPEPGWKGMLIVNTDGYVCDSYGLDANNELIRDPDTDELVINGGGVFFLGEDPLLEAGEIKLHDITITAPNKEGDCPL
jgi:hypothetical protein